MSCCSMPLTRLPDCLQSVSCWKAVGKSAVRAIDLYAFLPIKFDDHLTKGIFTMEFASSPAMKAISILVGAGPVDALKFCVTTRLPNFAGASPAVSKHTMPGLLNGKQLCAVLAPGSLKASKSQFNFRQSRPPGFCLADRRSNL